MNYFLIANNPRIRNKTIAKLPIGEKDLIILYNNPFALKWDKILKHDNKILFTRRAKNLFYGHDHVNYYKLHFKKIFLISGCNPNFPSDELISNTFLTEMNDKFGYSFDYFPKKQEDIYSHISFDPKISPQTGSISFLFVKQQLNPEDFIYLVGFTSVYKKYWFFNSKLWIGHSRKFEQNFYKNEMKKNSKIIKIDR